MQCALLLQKFFWLDFLFDWAQTVNPQITLFYPLPQPFLEKKIKNGIEFTIFHAPLI